MHRNKAGKVVKTIKYGNKWNHDFDRVIIDSMTKRQEYLDRIKVRPRNLTVLNPYVDVYGLDNNGKPYWNWIYPQHRLIEIVREIYPTASPNAILEHLNRLVEEGILFKYRKRRIHSSFEVWYSLGPKREWTQDLTDW